jgi:hypothetical protein
MIPGALNTAIALLAAAGFALLCMRTLSQQLTIAFAVYAGFYLLTFGIGAAVIAATQGTVAWLAIFVGMDTSPIPSTLPGRFTSLAVMPLVATGVAALLVRSLVGKSRVALDDRRESHRTEMGAVRMMFVLSAAYCLFRLSASGMLGHTLVTTADTDYMSLISLRTSLAGSLGALFFGNIYIVLPMLVAATAWQYIGQRKMIDLIMLIFMSAVALFFYLSIFAKSQIIIFLIFIVVAVALRQRLTWRTIGSFGLVALAALSLLGYLQDATDPLSILDDIWLVIFRVAVSGPYFVTLYPEVLPHAGLDLGLQFFGIGPGSATNVVVMNYMYPTLNFVQGTASAPSQIVAYAEGGWPFVLVVMVLTVVTLVTVTLASRRISTPLQAGLFAAACVFLYYTTQGGFFAALTVSYGFVWALFGYAACRIIALAAAITAAGSHDAGMAVAPSTSPERTA